MEKTLILFILVATAATAFGQNCYVCSSSMRYTGHASNLDDCYDNPSVFAVTDCAAAATAASETAPYCHATFTIQDGVVTSVDRGCAFGSNDGVSSTTQAPSSTCTTTLQSGASNPTASTSCIRTCTTSQCNTFSTTGFTACPNNCSTDLTNTAAGGGNCNYFTGQCVCNTGFSGADCGTAATATVRSCLQCDEETDSTCGTATTGGTSCIAPEAVGSNTYYCTVSRTMMLDSAGAAVRTRVVRGCTTNTDFRNNQCSFTAPSDTVHGVEMEYTCTTTCGTDDCNTQVPTGQLANNETPGLYCVQCTSVSDSGACALGTTARTACLNSEGYCYAIATYYIANDTHASALAEPRYTFVSIERGCRTAALTKQCTSTAAGPVQRVTCQESCQEEGCNIGWPNRPMCSQCDSRSDFSGSMANGVSDYDDGYSRCVFNPPTATPCTAPYHQFCVFTAMAATGGLTSGLMSDRIGHSRSMVRTCSHFDIGTTCNTTSINGQSYRQCNHTCTESSCNQGNGSGRIAYNLILFCFPALLGFILQCFSF